MRTLERYWPFVSILSILVLLSSLFFFPASAGALTRLLFVLGPGMAIAFIVNRQVRTYHKGHITRGEMYRTIFFEVLGLLLAMALGILLSQLAAGLAVPLSGGGRMGIVIVMAASLIAGVGAAWLVKVTWGRWTRD